MKSYFYGPSDISRMDIEHFKQGYHLDTSDENPATVLVGQDERAGYVSMAALAQAALMYDGVAEPVTSETPADFFVMKDSDGKELKIGMYAVQAFIADETKRVAIERIRNMSNAHVLGDARMRLLMDEFTWEKAPA